MLSKHDIIFNVDDVHDVFVIVLTKVLQDLEFNTGLVVVLLLVLDNFDGYLALVLVVNAAECRTKAAFAEELDNLVAVAYMITDDYLVVTLVIVITVIEYLIILLFLGLFSSDFLFLIGAARRLLLCLRLGTGVRRRISAKVLINFLVARLTKEVDCLVVEHLALLVVCQLLNIELQDVLRRCRKGRSRWYRVLFTARGHR